jgi:signal transduction histidine kinase
MSDRVELQRIARKAASDLGARVIVVGARGRLLADSAGVPRGVVSYASRPEIRLALGGRRAQGERQSETLGQKLLYTAVPITNRGTTVGAVRVTQSVAQVSHRIRRSVLVLIAIGAFALLIGVAIAWVIAGSLSKPLRNLARTARRVESGELEARADVAGPAENREVAVAFNDMTERLERVLESQRQFVANASHQLRTPLTGLQLRLESARAKSDGPEVERELAAAEREVERLARLLAALLTLARETAERPEARPVSLLAAAESAHERWQRTAADEHRRLVLAGEGDPTVGATDEDIAIVLDNLIENALRYSPAPSTVTVAWGDGGGDAWLAVLDEGPGVAEGEATQLFERFARGRAGSNGPAGTGLGLAIVQTLAERWHGRATIRNRDSGGARAGVRLPKAPTMPP